MSDSPALNDSAENFDNMTPTEFEERLPIWTVSHLVTSTLSYALQRRCRNQLPAIIRSIRRSGISQSQASST